MLGNVLLGIVSICTFISYFPQTVKLIKTKKSEDLSIQSWILWVVSSLSYTLYAVIISKDFMLIFETSLELTFCLIILVLAVKYRKMEVVICENRNRYRWSFDRHRTVADRLWK